MKTRAQIGTNNCTAHYRTLSGGIGESPSLSPSPSSDYENDMAHGMSMLNGGGMATTKNGKPLQSQSANVQQQLLQQQQQQALGLQSSQQLQQHRSGGGGSSSGGSVGHHSNKGASSSSIVSQQKATVHHVSLIKSFALCWWCVAEMT